MASAEVRKTLSLFENLYYVPTSDETILASSSNIHSSSLPSASKPLPCLYSFTLEKELGGARCWLGLVCNEIKVELSRDGAKGKDGSIRDKGQGKHRSTASRGAAASDASKDISIMDKLVAQLQQGQEGSVLKLNPEAFKQTLASRSIVLVTAEDGADQQPGLSAADKRHEEEKAFERELRRRGIARDSETGRKLRAMHREQQQEAQEMKMIRMAVLSARSPEPSHASNSKLASPFEPQDDAAEDARNRPVKVVRDGNARAEAFKGMVRARLAACLD